MEEKQTARCDHCGQTMKKYWHGLTPGLVSALIKFRKAVISKNLNSVHLLKDMSGDYELSRHEWNNFTKLRFHGLAVKDKNAPAGYWLLTKRGASFLKGDLDVPRRVLTFNNRVEDHSTDVVNIKDVNNGAVPYFETIDDIDYEISPPTSQLSFI